jgi:hypothetical protein
MITLSPPRIFRVPRYIFTRGDAHLPVREDRVRIKLRSLMISPAHWQAAAVPPSLTRLLNRRFPPYRQLVCTVPVTGNSYLMLHSCSIFISPKKMLKGPGGRAHADNPSYAIEVAPTPPQTATVDRVPVKHRAHLGNIMQRVRLASFFWIWRRCL